MTSPGIEPALFAHHAKVVAVLDVAESVRLMEEDEQGFIQRWHAFVSHARQLLPAHRGRMHKSLGDGLMLEFDDAPGFLGAAYALQDWCRQANTRLPAHLQIQLRVGAHQAEFVADEYDIYGNDVNLTARVATLAGPGEIVVTAALRDRLAPGLDADVEDLGECHLKHVREPVRAYRVGPVGPAPVVETDAPGMHWRPTIAVIPFAVRSADAGHALLGEAIADEVIAALCRTAELHVISRLSTTAFRDRAQSVPDIRTHLKASYILSGTCNSAGDDLALFVELIDAQSGHVVWAERLQGKIRGLFLSDSTLLETLVAAVSSSVLKQELQRAKNQALPTLESYTLLFAAIALMHRTAPSDFEKARRMIDHLIERSKRHPIPYAWLAKWHVLRAAQGWSGESGDAGAAMDATQRALDLDPDCSLALTIQGMVRSNLQKDLAGARECHVAALQKNPNESLAWLFMGIMHAFAGEGTDALAAAQRAQQLSPLDPLRYFYDSLSAAAAIAAGDFPLAIRYAQRSLKQNAMHLSSYRSLAMAQAMAGRTPDARKTVDHILRLDPGFTVRKFMDRHPGSRAQPDFTRRLADALQAAGVPQ